jgi:hypothetical protein
MPDIKDDERYTGICSLCGADHNKPITGDTVHCTACADDETVDAGCSCTACLDLVEL